MPRQTNNTRIFSLPRRLSRYCRVVGDIGEGIMKIIGGLGIMWNMWNLERMGIMDVWSGEVFDPSAPDSYMPLLAGEDFPEGGELVEGLEGG